MSTRVGYSGGTQIDPTYECIGDHTESIEITFDSQRISYDALLSLFWDSHWPTHKIHQRQYASLIFAHNPLQHDMAMRSKKNKEQLLGETIMTEILPATKFHEAEAYHQKYYLRRYPDIWNQLLTSLGSEQAIIASYEAAKLNGLCSQNPSLNSLKDTVNLLLRQI